MSSFGCAAEAELPRNFERTQVFALVAPHDVHLPDDPVAIKEGHEVPLDERLAIVCMHRRRCGSAKSARSVTEGTRRKRLNLPQRRLRHHNSPRYRIGVRIITHR